MKRKFNQFVRLAAVALAAVFSVVACAQEDATQQKDKSDFSALEEQAYTIGTQAYIFGYTLNELYRTMYELHIDPDRDTKGSVNEFNHVRRPATPEDTWVVTVNNDTLYSRISMDLSNGPLVLSIPDINDGRRFYFPLGDFYHNIFFKITATESGKNAAGDYAIVPPGWSGVLPDGLTRVNAPTPYIWSLTRTLVDPTPEDVAAVNRWQDQYTVATLEDWVAGKDTDFEADPKDYPVFDRVDATDPMKWYDTFNEMLRRNPPFPRDEAFVEQLKAIGLHPTQDFDPETADPAIVAGLTRAHAAGEAIIADTAQKIEVVNGWSGYNNYPDYGVNYLNRASAGMLGLLASDSAMTMARLAFVDAKAETLDGSNDYTLSFDKLPPVDDFWSLTVYKQSDKLLPENSLQRYSIGDRTEGITKNDDGSLTIHFSHDEPVEGTSNWMPVPEEPFYVVLRMYYPKFDALNGTWVAPGLEKTQ